MKKAKFCRWFENLTKEERSRIMRRVRAGVADVKFYTAESQLLQLSNFAAFAAFTARINAAPWENFTWEKI